MYVIVRVGHGDIQVLRKLSAEPCLVLFVLHFLPIK